MDPKYSWVVILLSVIYLLVTKSAEGYISNGAEFFEKTIVLVREDPNYENENISEFRPLRFRIDPNSISEFNSSTTMIRFELWVDDDTPSMFPVFISLIQRRENIQVQVPYTYHSKNAPPVRYTYASRTLCLAELDKEKDNILVSVTTGSSQLIGFHMKVIVIVNDKRLGLDKHLKMSITPMTPTFVRVPFNDHFSQNVVLKIAANNPNCIAVGIQQPKCPVFPLEDNFRGEHNDWNILSKHGAIRIDMRDFLNGFFVKVVLLQDDTICGKMYSRTATRRQTDLDIVLKNDFPISVTNGHFWLQMSIPPVLSLIVGVVIGSCYLITYACSRRRMLACRTYNVNKSENKSVCVQQFYQPPTTQSNNYGKWTILIFLLHALPVLEQVAYNGLISQGATGIYGLCSYNSLCSHNFWIFKDFNHLWSNISYLILGICFVFVSYVKKCLQKKSEEGEGVQYCVGLYYGMGLMLVAKGLMSFAYHFCPSKSNFQYDIIYLAFLVAICQLKVSEFRRPNTFSMDFSVSALTAILCILTLGITFERYLVDFEEVFFGFRMAVAVIQGIFIFYASIYAIYIGYPVNRVSKRIEKDEVPLQRMTIITGDTNAGSSSQGRRRTTDEQEVMRTLGDIPRFLWIFPKLWHWKLPKFRCERFCYVLLLLALNGYLIYFSLTANYCLYILAFMGSNFGLNVLYYLLMKIVFGEFTCSWKSLQVFFYLVVALGVGAAAGYFFLENMSEWNDPTSHYRTNDEECMWLLPYPFFDKHDTYHIISAHALFFVLMVLLSVDDGVEGVNREYLLAF